MSGSAYAYGEDCVFADRQRAFSAMETDFRVKVKVRDLGDKKALGDWMAKALQVIVSLPADEISGPQLGRVEFEFDATRSENLFVNVPLDQYQHRARELRGAELFDFFYDNP